MTKYGGFKKQNCSALLDGIYLPVFQLKRQIIFTICNIGVA